MPAATASVLRYITDPEVKQRMFYYIAKHQVIERGGSGWCECATLDIFENVWMLYNLDVCGQLRQPLLAEQVEKLLNQLTQTWSDTGIPSCTGLANDSDSTALAYQLLNKTGHPVPISALESYWQGTHFITYPYERDASLSVNIHAVEAVKLAGQEERLKQLLAFIAGRQQPDQPFWQDKWHVSPYYPSSHAVLATAKIDYTLIEPTIAWILYTQYESGGWGLQGETAEETALAIQALVAYSEVRDWNKRTWRAAQTGANYLRRHYRPFVRDEPPLWIGKNRYTPYLVVKSTILSALLMANAHGF